MANVSSFSGAMPVIPGGTVEVARLTATGASTGITIAQTFASASNLFSSSATVIADGSTSFLVEVHIPLVYSLAASFQGRVSLVNGTSEYGRVITTDIADAFAGVSQYGQMVITPSAGTLSLNARIWRNNGNSGNAYYGDGVGSNYAPALMRISKIVNQNDGLKPFWTPPVVTQLPSQATVGDQVIYAADATNGVYWQLQYDGLGTYPWKFVGGAPLWTGFISGENWSGSEFTASQTYTATGFTACSVTVPLPGDYDVSAKMNAYITGAHMGGMRVRKSTDATSYAWQSAHALIHNPSAAMGGTAMANIRFTALVASEILRMEHASSFSGASLYAWSRTMNVTPVRVKAA